MDGPWHGLSEIGQDSSRMDAECENALFTILSVEKLSKAQHGQFATLIPRLSY